MKCIHASKIPVNISYLPARKQDKWDISSGKDEKQFVQMRKEKELVAQISILLVWWSTNTSYNDAPTTTCTTENGLLTS